MKKKIWIISGVLITIVVIILLILLLGKTKYTVKVSPVDDRSPDRILTVYNSNGEKIKVKKIEYLDGTLLCNGYNTTVHFGDIENEKELKIILEDRSEYTATIVEEGVK